MPSSDWVDFTVAVRVEQLQVAAIERRERQEKNLHRKAREFGYKLEKIAKPETQPDAECK